MRLSLLVTLTTLTASSLATYTEDPICRYGTRRPECKGRPQVPRWRPGMKPELQEKCMTESDAETVAGMFQSIIRGYTIQQAMEALTDDFIDYSSAVSTIINKGAAVPKDLTQPIFTSRAEFMEGHGKQKPIPFETLDVWHNCNGTVSMRWMTMRSGWGQATEAAAIVSQTQPRCKVFTCIAILMIAARARSRHPRNRASRRGQSVQLQDSHDLL